MPANVVTDRVKFPFLGRNKGYKRTTHGSLASIRRQVVIGRWRGQAEIAHLKTCFYGSSESLDDNSRLEGCQLVQAWESSGRVPHAITATAGLILALLNAEDASLPLSIRLGASCTSWIRFVNGITDTQQIFRSKQSMFHIARKMRMPSSFIDLRHRIIHEERPNLRELVRALNKGLRWLFEWYWVHVCDSQDMDRRVDNEMCSGYRQELLKGQLADVLAGVSDFEVSASAGSNDRGRLTVDEAFQFIHLSCTEAPEISSHVAHAIVELGLRSCAAAELADQGRNDNIQDLSHLIQSTFHPYDALIYGLASKFPRIIISLQDNLLSLFTLAAPHSIDDHAGGAADWLWHLYTHESWDRYRCLKILTPELAIQSCVRGVSAATARFVKLIHEDPAGSSLQQLYKVAVRRRSQALVVSSS